MPSKEFHFVFVISSRSILFYAHISRERHGELTSQLLYFCLRRSDMRVLRPPLDHLIPCPTAVRAFAFKDEAKIHEVAEYMDSIFQQLDREHQKSGAASILDKRLMGTLEAAAQGLCSQHPRSTISNEAADAYRYIRALIVQTGVDP